MSQGPRHRAFLLGCNSEGLVHCEKDAQRLGRILEHRDWDAGHCHTSKDLAKQCRPDAANQYGPSGPADVAINAFSNYLADCRQGESVLIYFSGHSLFMRGIFYLVVGDDPNKPANRLNIETLITQLKAEQRPAERLLILDCCDAGEAVGPDYWSVQAGNWGRIWVATRRNEHAQELDGDTEGGLFTAQLLRALQGRMPAAISSDGCLSLDRMDTSIRDAVTRMKRFSGRPAPIPSLYGGTRDNMLLASNIEVVTSFVPRVLDDLETRLRDVSATESLVSLGLEVSRACALTAADDYAGPLIGSEAPGLRELIGHLAAPGYRYTKDVPIPLAEFVSRVIEQQGGNAGLQQWLDDTLTDLWQSIVPERSKHEFIGSLQLGRTRHVTVRRKSCLAIALRPLDANLATHYAIEALLVDDSGAGRSIDVTTEPVSPDGIPAVLKALVNDPAVDSEVSGRRLWIEFFLPKALLGRNLDHWCWASDPGVAPFSARHIVTVRALARLKPVPGDDDALVDRDAYATDWRDQWEGCRQWRDRRRSPGFDPESIEWVDDPGFDYWEAMFEDDACLFLLDFIPDPAGTQLDAILRDGAGAVFWCSAADGGDYRRALFAEVSRDKERFHKQPCFEALPQAVQVLRRKTWRNNQRQGMNKPSTGGYHLLWENADRIPEFTGLVTKPDSPAVRLSSPYD
jgi:hypothetical protein